MLPQRPPLHLAFPKLLRFFCPFPLPRPYSSRGPPLFGGFPGLPVGESGVVKDRAWSHRAPRGKAWAPCRKARRKRTASCPVPRQRGG
ncbi:unnamed protein product [Prunus armeniaca]|uniref:Uncharacterized protein n=1 Tax=Prunus armeniaca TaxID=36596 RepID=A0A6J5Y4G0_PRUAR|nr:unnamed protein product [Prunus armeniaca]